MPVAHLVRQVDHVSGLKKIPSTPSRRCHNQEYPTTTGSGGCRPARRALDAPDDVLSASHRITISRASSALALVVSAVPGPG